ncbi:hypothetical protein O9992_27285 [Vibrio lentus]|nr:hypothetical protein [Vibrio lentus]
MIRFPSVGSQPTNLSLSGFSLFPFHINPTGQVAYSPLTAMNSTHRCY